ncbi:hypothetical protein AD998_04330 [bacterium 336/3]|nr:hypothetical protein AD998_04330 [bacterium 336/3]
MILFILNAFIFGCFCFYIIFSFFIVVTDFGEFTGKEVADEISNKFTFYTFIIFLITIGINYLILKNIVKTRMSFLKSLILPIIGLFISILTLTFNKSKFIERQTSVTQLQHYLDSSIENIEVQNKNKKLIINNKDSVKAIAYTIYSLRKINVAYKFGKEYRIIMNKKDTIFSDGIIFTFKGKYFKSKGDFLDKYFEKL